MQQDEKKTGILIPAERLSKEALDSLIEEFILREGTDYGTREYSLDEKKKQVFNQLKAGHISILFDPQLENTTLLRKEELIKLGSQNFQILGQS